MVDVTRLAQKLIEVTQLTARDCVAARRPVLAACLLAACLCGPSDVRAVQQPARAGASTDATPTRAAIERAARQAARPEPPVIAVVHRLSGWKLRALVTPPDAPFAFEFDEKFVRMSVVAGYVMPDGRSVVARLPRAEAEMLNLPSPFAQFHSAARGKESELSLMRQDGSQVAARFVGFDSGTGLSLLEAETAVRARADDSEATPSVGQRVRLVAPLPAQVAAAMSESAAGPKPVVPVADYAPVGVEGFIHMSLGEVEGRLKAINHSPAGRVVGFTLESGPAVAPEWAGGVALSEAGALVGIVEQNAGDETRLLPAQAVRAAAVRVKSRRASVPQAWLGARGDAVAGAQLEFFLSQGWPREQAGELLRRRQGVLLTAVAPGTPAALAGLRPGDVVSRIQNLEVRSVEDMSWILREVGGNRPADFTILRAHEPPRSLQVQLRESQNPALETAQAEARAAEAEVRATETAVRQLDEQVRKLDAELAALDSANRKGDQVALRNRMSELQSSLTRAEAGFVSARARLEGAATRVRATESAHSRLAAGPLLPFGIEAMQFETITILNGVRTTRKGLVVAAVGPGSPAALGGVRAGDHIESVDGETQFGSDWRLRPSAPPPAEVTLVIQRDGKPLTLKLRSGTRD